jgi:hypothetical protein
MKIKQLLTYLFLLVILAPVNLKAQFVKKIQWDFLTVGAQKAGSKTIPTPDGTPEEIGDGVVAMASTAIWYNVNRKVSIGITGEISSNFLFYSFYDDERYFDTSVGSKQVRYTGYSAGVAAKYHFLDKKRLKAYGFTGINYFIHETWVPTYIYVYSPTDYNDFTIRYHSRRKALHNSLGGKVGVGLTAFFSKGFGMNFDAGYQNSGYYKGPTFNMGFFVAFING